MQTNYLFLNLFWRTIVAELVFGLLLVIIGVILSHVGIQLPSAELSATATFIKFKPTLLYTTFAVTLLIFEFSFNSNLIRMVFGRRLNLSPASWRQFVVAVSVLLLTLSVVNILVAFFASVDAWISYKLFGAFGLQLIGIYVIVLQFLKQKSAII